MRSKVQAFVQRLDNILQVAHSIPWCFLHLAGTNSACPHNNLKLQIWTRFFSTSRTNGSADVPLRILKDFSGNRYLDTRKDSIGSSMGSIGLNLLYALNSSDQWDDKVVYSKTDNVQPFLEVLGLCQQGLQTTSRSTCVAQRKIHLATGFSHQSAFHCWIHARTKRANGSLRSLVTCRIYKRRKKKIAAVSFCQEVWQWLHLWDLIFEIQNVNRSLNITFFSRVPHCQGSLLEVTKLLGLNFEIERASHGAIGCCRPGRRKVDSACEVRSHGLQIRTEKWKLKSLCWIRKHRWNHEKQPRMKRRDLHCSHNPRKLKRPVMAELQKTQYRRNRRSTGRLSND